MAADHLCFGDAVYLLFDDDDIGGCAQAQGFGEDNRLAIYKSQVHGSSFSKRSVYTVWQQQTFTHAVALRKEHEENRGGSTTRRSEVQRMEKLRSLAAKEEKRNQDAFEMIKGHEVRYGMMIMLRHEGSGRFMAVSTQSSEFDRDARIVTLSEEVGDEMTFCVMPQFGLLHSEGELIHYSDPVSLNSVSNMGLKLHVSRPRSEQQNSFEVLAATESSGFKLLCYRGVKAERAAATRVNAPLLFGGMPIRLMHVEANGYLQAR